MKLNPISFYYLDPAQLETSMKSFDDAYFQEITQIANKKEATTNNAQALVTEALKIERGAPLSTVDLYLLMDCPKRSATTKTELQEAYRQLILKYHPDKCHHLGIKDELFKGIQLAFDLLTDPKTRKSYDSMDPKNPIVPPAEVDFLVDGEFSEAKFNECMASYFDALSHFSERKMPRFDEIKEDKVQQFYATWLKYKSWRVFDLDSIMELRSTSGGRDERRHRQKELQKEWEKKRKGFAIETSETIQMAMGVDPRCVRAKEAELAAKEAKKEAAKQRKIEMAMKRNGGKLPPQPKKTVKPVKAVTVPEEWSTAEMGALIEAIKKYPGGTRERFSKIGEHIQKTAKTGYTRPQKQITKKIDALKQGDIEQIKALQTKMEKNQVTSEATIDYERQQQMK